LPKTPEAELSGTRHIIVTNGMDQKFADSIFFGVV